MAWIFYRHLLHTHPLKTKALTSSFITGLADVGLQLYEQNSNRQLGERETKPCTPRGEDKESTRKRSLPHLEWSRTLTLAAVGLVYSGPINHLWFATLEKLVRTQHQVRSVALKLVADQLFFVPVAISGYLTVRGVLEWKSEPQIRRQLQEKVALATKAAWQFWPFVNFVAFSMVPVMYRVLFGNLCAVWWNAKLSFISSQSVATTLEKVALPTKRRSQVMQEWTIDSKHLTNAKIALESFMTSGIVPEYRLCMRGQLSF